MWTAPRRGSLAMWCSFLGSGLGDRTAILGIFKPLFLECQALDFALLSFAVFALWRLLVRLCEV